MIEPWILIYFKGLYVYAALLMSGASGFQFYRKEYRSGVFMAFGAAVFLYGYLAGPLR